MIGSAIEAAKTVASLAQEYGKMDLYQKTVELMAQVTDLAAENFDLKTELVDLKAKMQLQEEVVFHDNHYWRKSANGEDGPFCTRCWDVEGRLVRGLPGHDDFECPACRILTTAAYRGGIK